LIIAMAATSFDRTARAIGPRAWRILHTSGVYYLWFQFMASFGMRIPGMPKYAWFLVPLLAVMALRIIAAVRVASGKWQIANRRMGWALRETHHNPLWLMGFAKSSTHPTTIRHSPFASRPYPFGSNPSRFATILSSMRLGRIRIISIRNGSGVIS
jgi:hypothetical protein